MQATNLAPSAGTGAFYLDERGSKLLRSIYQRAQKHNLKLIDTALYAALIGRAHAQQRAWVQVPIVVLAGELGENTKAISRSFARLVKAGWVVRHPSFGGAGEHEVTRTELPALHGSRSASGLAARPAQVTTVAPTADHDQTALPLEQARAITEDLKSKLEIRSIPVPSRRDQVAAEIAWSVLRCALSRLASREHGVNVALKTLRLGKWKTPRTMPSDFPAILYGRLQAKANNQVEKPAPVAASTVAVFRPASRVVAGQHLAQIASLLGQGTELSSNKATVGRYEESLCCATRENAMGAAS